LWPRGALKFQIAFWALRPTPPLTKLWLVTYLPNKYTRKIHQGLHKYWAVLRMQDKYLMIINPSISPLAHWFAKFSNNHGSQKQLIKKGQGTGPRIIDSFMKIIGSSRFSKQPKLVVLWFRLFFFSQRIETDDYLILILLFSKNRNWRFFDLFKYLKNWNRRFFKNSKDCPTLALCTTNKPTHPPTHHEETSVDSRGKPRMSTE
jgi:hypothetical protein